MKKKIFVLIGLLFILVIFWGCEEGIVDPSPLETPKYTWKISAHGSGGEISPSGNVQVLKGEALKISVSKETGVDVTATLDGKDLPLQRSKVDKSYFFKVNDITANAVVDVNFEKGVRYRLTHNRWELYSRENRLLSTNEYIRTEYVPKDLDYRKYSFDEDSISTYDFSGTRIGRIDYKILNEDSIAIGNGIKGKILESTDEYFRYTGIALYYEVLPEVRRIPEKDRLLIFTYKKVAE